MDNQQNNPTTPPQTAVQPPAAKSTSKRTRSKRRPQLNPKQALFVKLYTDRKSETFSNAYQSAIKAGYEHEYARKITAVLSENVSKTMSEALDQAGATDEALAAKHTELLNKREVHITKLPDGSTEAELIDQPDTQAVKAALDMAYKLKRHYPAEGFGHDLPAGTVIFISPDKDGRGTQGNTPEAASG
jgi:hypothetical protein